jgi:hypothetical protein
VLDKTDQDIGADVRRVDEAFAGHAEFAQLSGDPGAGLDSERALGKARCSLSTGEKDRVYMWVCVSAHWRLARRHRHYYALYMSPDINRTSVGIISSPVDGLVLVPNKREKHTDKEVDRNWHIEIKTVGVWVSL